jgi:hypothetical protein
MSRTPRVAKRASRDHSSQPTITRLEKLRELILETPAIENGLSLPDSVPRYVAVEQSTFGDTMWAYFEDSMTEIMQSLEKSETSFVERIRVHDLDTDQVYAPQWKIEALREVPS